MKFNYKIVEHTNEGDITLIEISNVQVLFTNIAPIERASQVFTLYNRVITVEELSQYDGTFTFFTRDLPIEITQTAFNNLFNILLDCEQREAIICIYVQLIDSSEEEESLILNDFISILDHSTIALTTKTFRVETQEIPPIVSMITMTYKTST